ncbi:hypothetical protein B0H63DRAFT_466244 [Podospora didyma]|uniref:Uncharacterized protein n=1 Tax=Podospora didyma TaxID=330526 RepID=A0AAE0NZU8_9PEZI|nr:hypothetical protein B0H63DRAFT_466244 [Podospora didyma]
MVSCRPSPSSYALAANSPTPELVFLSFSRDPTAHLPRSPPAFGLGMTQPETQNMSTINPNIANGTCYYAENTVTKGNFIPCGNELIQTWPCCKAGSYCLALGDANACWDAKSGNTYVAGCTDPSFVSPNCLHKPPPFHDQEWVAINQACTNLNANSKVDNITNWTGCVVDNNSTDLVKLPLAACTPYCDATNVLYAGVSSLPAYASLPTLSGSSIFWQNDFVPPTTAAPGYAPGVTTGIVGTGVSSKPRPSSSGPSMGADSSDLSPGAKAGIGVGAAIGGIILIAMLTTLILWCRRHGKRKQQLGLPPPGRPYNQPYSPDDMSNYPPSGGYPSPLAHPYSNTHQYQSIPGQPPIAEIATPSTPAVAYTGYKTELPADERKMRPSQGQEYVEMDNGDINPVPAQYLQPQPSPRGHQEQDQLSPHQHHGIAPPGSPPLSESSTMLHSGHHSYTSPSLQASPASAYGQPAGGRPSMGPGPGVYHSRSTSSQSQSFSSRVAAGGGLSPGVYHGGSVSSIGASPGTGYSETEGGWEAGRHQ